MPSYIDMGCMEAIIEKSDLDDEVSVKGGWRIGRIHVAKFMVKEASESE